MDRFGSARRYVYAALAALSLFGVAAFLSLTIEAPDCDDISVEKWPMSCIERAEARAAVGDIRSMEALSLAYPNAGNAQRSYFWLMEAATRGSLGALYSAADLCPRPPLVTRETVGRAIKSAANIGDAERSLLDARLRKTCSD